MEGRKEKGGRREERKEENQRRGNNKVRRVGWRVGGRGERKEEYQLREEKGMRRGVASFPGSLLTPTKNRKGGGERGINSHVIPQHDDVTPIIA